MRTALRLAAVMLAGTWIACDGSNAPTATTPDDAPQIDARPQATPAASADEVDAFFMDAMEVVNAGLDDSGAGYRVAKVEYLTAEAPVGREVFFRDVGNKQLGADFVPGDPRRADWSGTSPDITYVVDQVDAEAPTLPPGEVLAASTTTEAVNRAMAIWDDASCSDLPVTRNADFGLDLGLIAFFAGLGDTQPFVLGDIQHAGWGDLPLGGSVIGGTFTFIFIDGNGDPTDVDGDGKSDVAFREIYYSTAFPWGIDTGFPIDVETVVAHEAGHGLSQAHFGKLFQTTKNEKFHFAPRALMNAGYTGVQQELSGTDRAGHCSLWGEWPAN